MSYIYVFIYVKLLVLRKRLKKLSIFWSTLDSIHKPEIDHFATCHILPSVLNLKSSNNIMSISLRVNSAQKSDK